MLKKLACLLLVLLLMLSPGLNLTRSVVSANGESDYLKVNGRYLYDPRGDRIIVRGVENFFGWGLYQSGECIDEIAKTGANAIRILPNMSQLTLAEVENLIQKAISKGMIVYITPANVSNNVAWFCQSNVKALMDRYSKYLVLDAVGETTHATDAEWVSDVVDAIRTMRAYGYKHPLCVISRNYGRNPHTILNNAQYVLNQDPERNVIFGVQVYWTDWYISQYGMTIEQACSIFAQQNFMVQVGVCAGCSELWAGAYDYRTLIEECHQNNLSWLYWDWHNPYGSLDSLSYDGIYGHWNSNSQHPYGANFGQWIAVSSPYSIQNTAQKTPFLLESMGSPPPGTGTGLLGEYYDNMNFTNLKLTRTDATVNFDWGSGSPDPSIGSDTFSVRWTGQVEPLYSETYTFYTVTDDGVRLWVNNQLIIDKWVDQSSTEWSGTISLSAGQKYDIKMEYYENGGGALAKLLWSSSRQPKQVIPASQLYPGTTQPPPPPPGNLMAYDPMSASTGPLHGASSGSGWGGAWQVQNNNTAVPGYNISNSSPMSYGSLARSGNYAIGGREYLTSGRRLDTSSNGPFKDYLSGTSGLIGASGKTLWMSFLLRKDANNDQPCYVFTSNEPTVWYPHTPLVSAGYFGSPSHSGGTRYWTLKIGTSSYYRTNVPVTIGQTVLLVVKIEFGSTNTVSLYVNPSSLGGNPPSSPSASATATSSLAFRNFGYYGGEGTNQSSLDEIRFGDSFAAVTPVN